MTSLKSRSKLITFRLDPQEHEALKQVCVTSSARSVSEFAREAVLNAIESNGTRPPTLTGDLQTISAGLRDLDDALQSLRTLIARILGRGTSNASSAGS